MLSLLNYCNICPGLCRFCRELVPAQCIRWVFPTNSKCHHIHIHKLFRSKRCRHLLNLWQPCKDSGCMDLRIPCRSRIHLFDRYATQDHQCSNGPFPCLYYCLFCNWISRCEFLQSNWRIAKSSQITLLYYFALYLFVQRAFYYCLILHCCLGKIWMCHSQRNLHSQNLLSDKKKFLLPSAYLQWPSFQLLNFGHYNCWSTLHSFRCGCPFRRFLNLSFLSNDKFLNYLQKYILKMYLPRHFQNSR